jgi:DNA recombination protein RmuC
MIAALIVLQLITLAALVALWMRKPATLNETVDPRHAQLLAADLPTQFTRLDARSEALDGHLRVELAQLRTETESRSTALRTELIGNLTTLGTTLITALETARTQNESGAVALRESVEKRLDSMNVNNEKKLEQMRITVDEKLQATLHTRITESFGLVTDKLTKVHEGLGEMSKVSTGMESLSRVFSNVKARGTIGEVLLGTLLDQMLAPSQFVRNAQVKPNTRERVEFAVRFPGAEGDVLLPIDSNFPRESWERLQTAYETGLDILKAGNALESAIRSKARDICDLYINEPVTTPNAILFVPSEGLYAEIMRRDGFQSELQQKFHVTIAGPNNLAAILTCFQMVFQLINLQKKGGEVWKVLATAKTEFGKFEGLMATMGKQVGTVQKTIDLLGVRTRAINKTLSDVSGNTEESALPMGTLGGFDGMLPMLAASEEDEAT